MAAGRLRKYETAAAMQVVINAYFNKCESTYGTERPEYPTVTGLALALGLTRQGLLEQCKRNDEFSDTVNMAKSRVEAFIEQRLYSGQATGSIFNLKNNFGWVDAIQNNNNNTVTLIMALNDFARKPEIIESVQEMALISA